MCHIFMETWKSKQECSISENFERTYNNKITLDKRRKEGDAQILMENVRNSWFHLLVATVMPTKLWNASGCHWRQACSAGGGCGSHCVAPGDQPLKPRNASTPVIETLVNTWNPSWGSVLWWLGGRLLRSNSLNRIQGESGANTSILLKQTLSQCPSPLHPFLSLSLFTHPHIDAPFNITVSHFQKDWEVIDPLRWITLRKWTWRKMIKCFPRH